MKLQNIKKSLEAQVAWGEHHLAVEILSICGADLMSDVLALNIQPQTLLITSLVNTQVIRTADMVDLAAIVFLNGKIPNEQIIAMAQSIDLPILITPLNMFESCGRLYLCKLADPH